VIEIRDLTYAYVPGRPILSRINLQLKDGESVTILGRNGSGKSTLLRCIVGLLDPTAGEIRAPSASSMPAVGLVFQNPDDQIVSPTVESEAAFGLENLAVPTAEMRRRVDEILDQFGLAGHKGSDPHKLSGGERQRLAIVSIAVMNPQFILFDEPFAMLDPASREDLRSLICSLPERGTTPVVVGQDPDLALDSDRLLILDQGQIAADGNPKEILSDPSLLAGARLSTTETGRVAEGLSIPPPLPTTIDQLLDLTVTQPIEVPPTTRKESSAKPIVEVRDLAFTYDRGLPSEHQVFNNLDLSVNEGEIVSIVGPSGSGKSTLVLHLNGLHQAQSGSVTVKGLDASAPENGNEIRSRVGLVFQFPESQLFAETVAQDIQFGPDNLGLDDLSGRVNRALETVGLSPTEFAHRNPFTLSGGEKRRVALAGVLATDPDLLILDEPSAGLDQRGADEFDQTLMDLNQAGVTIVLVTHDLTRALTLSDRVIALSNGTIVQDAPPDQYVKDPTTLANLGIPIPVGVLAIESLRQSGVPIPDHILTPQQLVHQPSDTP